MKETHNQIFWKDVKMVIVVDEWVYSLSNKNYAFDNHKAYVKVEVILGVRESM